MSLAKALVLGYGSIGARHTEILKALGLQVDIVSRRGLTVPQCPVFAKLDQALSENSYDLIVIANETSEHLPTLKKLAATDFQGLILAEKPLTQFQDPFLETLKNSPLSQRIFVGYNLRFHPMLEPVKQALKSSRLLSAWMYCGQYLPLWRPHRPYQESYSSSKAAGGGVLRDLSHEIDLIHWLFPRMQLQYSDGGHWSQLQSDSDDHFTLHFSQKGSSLGLHLNAVDRLMQRRWIFNFENDSLSLDLNAGELTSLAGTQKFTTERNTTYIEMHKALLSKEFQKLCRFDEALRVLKTIDEAETAAQQRRQEIR